MMDTQSTTETPQIDELTSRLMGLTLAPLRGQDSHAKIPAKTQADLEWGQLIDMLEFHAVSPEGNEVCRALAPLPKPELAERRMLEVAECVTLIAEEGEVPLRGLRDMRKALSLAVRGGTLLGTDLEVISRNCDVASRTRRFLKHRSEHAPTLAVVAQRLDPLRDIREVIDRAVEPGGRLTDAASPELKRLRRAVQNQTDRIKARVEKLLRSDALEHMLQDDFFTVRDDRYVLPIRVSNKRQLDGIVHGYSSSGQTAFIEPQELIELNNQLRWAQIEVDEEERRILQRLTEMVAEYVPALTINLEVLAYLDFISSCALLARKIEANPVTFGDAIELRHLRHPMLFAKLAKEDGTNETVANDVGLSNNILVISGPNTGGKTVLLKSVGLAALMARCGLPVTADEGSKVPFIRDVFTDIGDEQSIERDLSTFSSHLVNIKGFVEVCNSSTLVLLDELFTGTDPHQGAALGAALLEKLADSDSRVLVTTHLEGLKMLAIEDDRFTNASMGFDIDSLEPTYQVIMGLPGSSYALRIARRLGLNSDVIDRATTLLEDGGGRSLDQILANLEGQVEELNRERSRYERERADAQKLKTRYEAQLKKVTQREKDIVTDEALELKAQLVQAREILRSKIVELTSAAKPVTHKDVDRIQRHVKEAEDKVNKVREQVDKVEATDTGHAIIQPADLEEGMDVFIPKFGKKGVLVEYEDGAKDAMVQLGVMKTTVSVSELCYPTETNRRQHAVGKSPAPAPASEAVALQTSSNTLDLRGMRVDEAVDRVELFLDSAFLNHEVAIFIIHGHGTGALKRAVRDHLGDSRYVRDFRRGERGEGGDGVTVAYLNSQV